MMIEETAAAALPQKKTINHYLRKWYYGILYWIQLHIWYRYCYRHVMKLLHRCNLHYTTVVMPFETDDVSVPSAFSDKKYKKQQLWCQWCGLRGDILKDNR